MKRKFSKILGVGLALALLASFLVTATPVAAADITVGGDFTTIQEAIDYATPGDTIIVGPGIYSTITNGESFPITIDKSLTLKGAQFGVDPTVSGARTVESEESVIDATSATGNAVEITVNGVILDGFTIKNATTDVKYGVTVLPQSGDHSVYSSEIIIQNNILTDNNRGIKIVDNENSLVNQNRIVNCNSTFTSQGGSGIVLSYVSPTTIVTENLLTGNTAGNTYYGPILVMYGRQYTQPTISYNRIVNNHRNCPASWGILVLDSSAIIRGNIITGNDMRGIGTMWGTADIPTILIEENEISGNSQRGIEITIGTFAVSVIGNTIAGNGGAGIDVQPGITTDVTVHYNRIFGNGEDGYGLKSLTVSVDATYNYWGDATGPDNASNPHGVGQGGDKVSDTVDFTPWYATATTTPLTENVSVEHNPTIALSDTIQGGIDAALAGDIITCIAGTYDEQVLIDKTLTLQGANAGVNPVTEARGPESVIQDATGPRAVTIIAHGVTVDGFEVNGGGTVWGGIVENTPVTGTTVENNIVHGFTGIGIPSAAGSSGGSVLSNEVTDCYAGVYLSTGATDFLIEGNWLHDNAPSVGFDAGSAVCFEGNNTGVMVTRNTLEGNNFGLYVWSGFGDDYSGTVVSFNDIFDNAIAGVQNAGGGTVDALYNWWGDETGPEHTTLNTSAQGNAVSGNVLFSPWLYKMQEDFISDAPIYAGSVVIANEASLVDITSYAGGWNSFSTPVTLAGSTNTWGDILALTTGSNLDILRAQRFDNSTQQWVLLSPDYKITPGEGFFIQVKTGGSLPILCNTNVTFPPRTDLLAGWNLVGVSDFYNMAVLDALSGISYSVVLSALPPNVEAWSVPPVQADEAYMLLGEAYWVAMGEPGILFGFTTTPVAEDMTWELNQ